MARPPRCSRGPATAPRTCAALLLLAGGCAQPRAITPPLPTLSSPSPREVPLEHRFHLANGLSVALEESHAAPVVAFQAWVRVGSADEPEELAGIAHVFEHMLFKGTARRGVGRIAREVESAGGEINAWTSYDQTVFHVVIASRYLDTALDIIADALQNSSFAQEELERELKVVLEEVKQGDDSPSRMASQQLFATAYRHHPYRRPVIGSAATVGRLTRARLLDFFRRHYRPDNITLVAVGDFDSSDLRRRIAAAWGSTIETGAPPRQPPPVRPPEPPQREPRFVVKRAPIREAHLALAFHIPPLVHEDAGALDIAGTVLGQGDSAWLQSEVKRNRQLVNDIYAFSYTPRDPGLLVVGATLAGESVSEATRAILGQLFRLVHGEVKEEEIERARTILEADAVYQRETVQGQARKLGFFETVTGSLAYEREYERQLRAVTPASLRAVAARYLKPDNATLSLLAPNDQPSSVGPADLGRLLGEAWAASQAQTVPVAVANAAVGAVAREVLPGGATVLVLRDPSTPLVAIRAVWSGGLRLEDAKTNGINNLLAALMTRGTRRRTGDDLAREIEGMAGTIGGFSGRNSFGLRAEVLARHGERALELVGDCLLHPAFGELELERERRLALEEIRAQEDNIGQVAFRAFATALYRDHPYHLDVLGTADSVARLSRRRLVDFYRRHFPPSRLTIAVVGDVVPERILGVARRLFSAAAPPPGEPPSVPPPPRVESPIQVIRHLNKQQAHLVLGFPGTTVSSPDRYPLEVLATILSGQGGRLFVELRDKRALAYRVSAHSMEGLDPGYFAAYVATSPANLEAAEAAIRDELHKLIDHPVSEAELERAKRYLVGAHDISLQRRAAVASTLAFHEAYGLGWDEYRRYSPATLAVTAADVQRVARQYLDPQRAVLAVVKPEEVSPAIAQRRGQVAARKELAEGAAAKANAAQLHRRRPPPRPRSRGGR